MEPEAKGIGPLIQKIERYRKQFESNPGSNCLLKALELYDRHQGGEIRYIVSIEKILINHTYYIPPHSRPTDTALNQADNGYPQYPPLTVEEARTYGIEKSADSIRRMNNPRRIK